METNVPGVHVVPSYSNSYVIDGDEGVTLIDTGLPKRHGSILEVLSSIGRSWSDVRIVAVTHSHSDHVGGAAAVRRETGAQLFAPVLDAPAIRGDAPDVPPPLFGRVPGMKALFRFVPGAEPVEVDHMVSEADTAGLPADLRVIDTPGHTPGHVSYLLHRDGGVLFVGDAAVATRKGTVKRGWMNGPTPTFDASLRRLAGFEFDTAFFAHSKPLPHGARAAFERFAATIAPPT